MNLQDVKQQLEQEFAHFQFGLAQFPLLFQTGVEDAAVHSAGVSYLLGLGLEFGLSAIVEYPITMHAEEHWKTFGRIFPDSIWFHPATNQPWICFEFERFEKGDEQKIRQKAHNLALSFYQSQQHIELCVLVYWLRTGLAPNSIEPIQHIFLDGFQLQNKQIPAPTCQFLLYKFVLSQASISAKSNANRICEGQADYLTKPGEGTRLVVSKAFFIGGKQ